MSLYKQYVEERTTKAILETTTGFVLYSFPDPTTVYIEDIYVKLHKRKSREAYGLANQVVDIAKKKGCIKLLGSVVPSAKNSTVSLKFVLGYGMNLDSCTNDFILFSRNI